MEVGATSKPIKDYELSRYACYFLDVDDIHTKKVWKLYRKFLITWEVQN